MSDLILTAVTIDLEAVPDGLLFLSMPATLPYATPVGGSADTRTDDALTLYHWTRHENRLAVVADHQFTYAVSPDGARVVSIDVAHEQHWRVTVRRLDGSAPQVVADLTGDQAIPSLPPAWHGNDRVTFQSPLGLEQPRPNGKRVVYDLVDLPVPPNGPAGPARMLSRDWPDAMRPSVLFTSWGKTIQAPATRPVQSPR